MASPRDIRARASLTLGQMAEKTGFSISYVHKVECDRERGSVRYWQAMLDAGLVGVEDLPPDPRCPRCSVRPHAPVCAHLSEIELLEQRVIAKLTAQGASGIVGSREGAADAQDLQPASERTDQAEGTP